MQSSRARSGKARALLGLRPTRARRSIVVVMSQWVALLTCVIVAITWLVSVRWTFGYSGGESVYVVFAGQIRIVYATYIPPHMRGWNIHRRKAIEVSKSWPEKHVSRLGHTLLIVPLWLPLGILLFPTALLWWCNLGRPRGGCRNCGYDLTGNVSGTCPECGKTCQTRSSPHTPGTSH